MNRRVETILIATAVMAVILAVKSCADFTVENLDKELNGAQPCRAVPAGQYHGRNTYGEYVEFVNKHEREEITAKGESK